MGKRNREHPWLKDSNFRLFAMGVALLSLTLSAFVTTTLAWFDISDNLIVNDLSISFQKGTFFQVGLKKEGEVHYFQNLTPSELERYSNYKSDQQLSPITSAFQEEWLSSISDPSTVEPLFHASPISKALAKGGYYQFDFYFLSDRDAYLYLDSTTSLIAAREENEKTAKKSNLTPSALENIENCARVSFYNAEMGYKIYEPNAEVASTTSLGGRLDLSPKDGYFDYDGDQKEILYGDFNEEAKLRYSEEARVNQLSPGQPSCFNALTESGVQALDLGKSKAEGGLKIKQEQTYLLSDLVHDPSSNELGNPLAYVPMGEPTRLVVSVYVEGWDYDAIEEVADASFNLKLVFSAYLRSRAG